MYYLLIIVAIVLFGGGFAVNDLYRRTRGISGIKMSLEMSLTGAIGGIIVLSLVNCLDFEGGVSFDIRAIAPGFTPFTVIMATFAAINSIAFTYFSFMALGSINLSVYSLFSMLGGMLLPFVQGIIFFDEKMTVSKIVCLALILPALALTVNKNGKSGSKMRYVYYGGVFVLNGMSGVISKIFSESKLPKTSPAGYSVWCALISATLGGTLLLLFFRKKKEGDTKYTARSALIGGSYGVLNKTGNFLVVLALSNGVDVSIEAPMVTGGVIIVSTLACLFSDKKPGAREIVSVVLALLGTLALFVI